MIRNLNPSLCDLSGPTFSPNRFGPTIGTPFTVVYGLNLYIGKTSMIGANCVINDTPIHKIVVGERVAIDPGVIFTAQSGHEVEFDDNATSGMGWTLRRDMQSSHGDIIVEDDVQIEAGATIV